MSLIALYSKLKASKFVVTRTRKPPAKKDKEDIDFIGTIKRIYPYYRPYKWTALLVLVISFPAGLLDGAIAFSLKPFIDALSSNKSFDAVIYLPFVIVGLTVVQALLNYWGSYLNDWLGNKIMTDFRRVMYEKMMSLDVNFFDNTTSAFIIQRFFRDTEIMRSGFLDSARLFISRITSSICLTGVLLFISWKLAIISMVVVVVMLFPSTRMRKIVRRLTKQENKDASKILTFYTCIVNGIRLIKGYNLTSLKMKTFDAVQDKQLERRIKAARIKSSLNPIMQLITAVGIAWIIWEGHLMVVRGEITQGGLVSFLVSMMLLFNPLKNMGNSIMSLYYSFVVSNRLFAMLDMRPQVVNKPEAKQFTELQEAIEFRNVTFSYAPNKPVLKNISFKIHRGEMVAIVGLSGGGKTTIANLIPRFYDVNDGAILLDGVDLRDYQVESIRDKISLVLQDNYLLDATLGGNIRIGKVDATKKEILSVLEKVNMREYVESLPEGIMTKVGEQGMLLSGGQRQRIAIARAMIRNAEILILDEATSALDSYNETLIHKSLETVMKGKTVIVIAHRLSTIRNANRILVIDQGQIVEEGTHEELMKLDGHYAMLYNSQYKSYTTHLDNQPEEVQLVAERSA